MAGQEGPSALSGDIGPGVALAKAGAWEVDGPDWSIPADSSRYLLAPQRVTLRHISTAGGSRCYDRCVNEWSRRAEIEPDLSTRRTAMRFGVLAVAMITALLLAPNAGAERATLDEMSRVCENWLSYIVEHEGDWAGDTTPYVTQVQDVTRDGVLLGRCYSIAPRGYVLVPALKEMMPVKAYSTTSNLDLAQSHGYAQLLRRSLEVLAGAYVETFGSLDAVQPEQSAPLFDRHNRSQWSRFASARDRFQSNLRAGLSGDRTVVGPLLATAWHQGSPYNKFCPMGDGGQCVVGCVATAAAQAMKHFDWPPAGVGDHSYYWNGDDSCGGSTPGETLYADFSDPYDWDNMPGACNPNCGENQENALGELNYEVAVAFNMDFGHCGSGAYTSYAATVLPQYFLYDPSIDNESRSQHTAASWFEIVKYEVNNNRPMLYSFLTGSSGHAVVCDGWADEGGVNQYHINYGWGGEHTGFYTVDNIYGSYDPMSEKMVRRIMPPPATATIQPDGTGDYATIQDAVSALWGGCVIELADGVYTGDGNRDIDFAGKSVTVRSQSGNPEACIIDCQATSEDPHSAFIFEMEERPDAVVENITITNAHSTSGGAVRCANASEPTFNNVVFLNNNAGFGGGAHVLEDAAPTFNDCAFIGNTATLYGGAVRIKAASATMNGCIFLENACNGSGGALDCRNATASVSGCTFAANAAQDNGGAVSLFMSSSPEFDTTILSFSTLGEAVYAGDGGSTPTFACCDIFGNEGGPGAASGWIGTDNNFSTDPLFCDADAGDLTLCSDSPCAADFSPCGQLIGALDVGCGACGVGSGVDPESIAKRLRLDRPAPNPFDGRTLISYTLPSDAATARVTLAVFDPAGRLVRTLVDEPQAG
ncbi:MAG: hypothetical protein GF355_14000, partial [Candidatus Eisenbacteria bacterium]|nr:hypothetical protein [Candidatus Eisenbacteria bacterium]